MTAPLLPPERLARLVEDAPPAAEPAILARVEGEVTNLPHGHAITETETGDRVMTPEWPGAHVGQRVEVLVRALDGVDVPAPPASEAPRPLTEVEIEECAKAGYDAVPAEEPYDEWNHPSTDREWWVARAALTLTDRGSLGAHFDEAVRAKAAEIRARTPAPKPEETP